jgi:hypothetical protein
MLTEKPLLMSEKVLFMASRATTRNTNWDCRCSGAGFRSGAGIGLQILAPANF